MKLISEMGFRIWDLARHAARLFELCNRAARGGLSALGECCLDLRHLLIRQSPAHASGIVLDLARALGAAQCGGHARLMNCPVDHQFCNRLTRILGNRPQIFQKILVLLPLVAMKHGVFLPAVARVEHVIPRQLPRQQPFHQRPVNDHGNAVRLAPGKGAGLDFALQHIVVLLKRRQWANGRELGELFDRGVRQSHRSRLTRFEQFFQCTRRFGNGHIRIRGVQVQQIDPIGREPPQALFALPLERRRRPVSRLLAVFPVNAPFGGDDDFVAARGQRAGRSSARFPLRIRSNRPCRKINPCIDGGLQGRQAVGLVDADAGDARDGPATHRDGRDENAGRAQRPQFRMMLLVHAITGECGGLALQRTLIGDLVV